MREFVEVQSYKSRDKKSSWSMKGYSWTRLCHFTGLLYFSSVPKTHGASSEVWFGFTRMDHLNFNSSVATSFSKCVCLVFDYCQFDCSLHIKCYFRRWNSCSLIKSLISLPSLKALHGFKYIFLVLLRYDFSSTLKFSVVMSINLCHILFSDSIWHNCPRINNCTNNGSD